MAQRQQLLQVKVPGAENGADARAAANRLQRTGALCFAAAGWTFR